MKRRALLRCAALLSLCCSHSSVSAFRQDAKVVDLAALQPEAEEVEGIAFNTKEHDAIVTEACAPAKGLFAADPDAKARLARIVPGGAADLLCESMRLGALWPDCPTYRDSFTLQSACIDFPIVGSMPFHEGMLQMGRQLAWQKFGKLWHGQVELNEISTFRQAEQHKHGSPLAPLYEDARHIALVTNRQLKMKMLQQSIEWHCKGSHALADGLRTESTLKLQLGAFFMGKILHTVQDTFTLSHARRSISAEQISQAKSLLSHQERVADAEKLLQAIPIQQAYSMDDVRWAAHASVDKGRHYAESSPDATVKSAAAEALEDAAVLATAQVIRVFAELIRDASNAGDVSTTLLNNSVVQLGKVLCDTVWRFQDESQGAGGSLKELGLNGDNSTWTPEVAADKHMQQRVSDELRTLVQAINEKRQLGKLALDPGIEFRYPAVTEDYCKNILDGSLSCAAVGYTAALSEPIFMDRSWGYSLHMKIWFFLVGALLGCAFVCCVVSRVRRHCHNANAAARAEGDEPCSQGSNAAPANGPQTCLGNTTLAPIVEAEESLTATSTSAVSSAVSAEAKDTSSLLLPRASGSGVGAGD
mmetsp:Transcript_17695/g.41029  ORF Transcript_17695/g.41029 Transcript_17695/m.41029 type:complete len:589 (-) Transcript_17695:105-1871(-)